MREILVSEISITKCDGCGEVIKDTTRTMRIQIQFFNVGTYLSEACCEECLQAAACKAIKKNFA